MRRKSRVARWIGGATIGGVVASLWVSGSSLFSAGRAAESMESNVAGHEMRLDVVETHLADARLTLALQAQWQEWATEVLKRIEAKVERLDGR